MVGWHLCSHFSPLCSTVAGKKNNFLPRRPLVWNCHKSATTLRNLCPCTAVKTDLTSLLTAHLSSLQPPRNLACYPFKVRAFKQTWISFFFSAWSPDSFEYMTFGLELKPQTFMRQRWAAKCLCEVSLTTFLFSHVFSFFFFFNQEEFTIKEPQCRSLSGPTCCSLHSGCFRADFWTHPGSNL